MQLWKKNFLLASVVSQLLIFGGLLFFNSFFFHQMLRKQYSYFYHNQQNSVSQVDFLLANDTPDTLKEYIKKMNHQQGFYYLINKENQIIFDNLPEDKRLSKQSNQGPVIQKKQNAYFLSQRINYGDDIKVSCLQDITFLYEQQNKQVLLSIVFGCLLSAVISIFLYWQMKKIYRPIQNLSHELRTPLTLIAGYSELLFRTKTTEQEKIEMSQSIYKETEQLMALISQLLIMGDLKEGEIKKQRLLFSERVNRLKGEYPQLQLESSKEEAFYGNKILIDRLIVNLLDNASRASSEIKVKIQGSEIMIENDGPHISPVVLKKLNSGKELSPDEHHGSGKGFRLCREIIFLHEGKITLYSRPNHTEVIISLKKA
ncbi:sensor histidine kinase [Vagococcus elongatus]|uniref:histidine kinase n=1 Tax=Vagococcus elongatus TaxID=180344 RepID=A0A430B4F0_9ENTE|nr:HAMP domain-containing sensor histidine kinase [Vagococcus elongatus]RSU15236.1 hypothetical protein CBF29_02575 [Vagococcus elongatus]